jgi:RNA polymerase sigma factor (sigma-70 family)
MSVVQSTTADDADDVELARRATAGDGEAFGQLFERWFDRVFDVAWHVVRNRDTAAEVAQDAFAAAWQQITTLRQPGSFGGWLLRIGRNRALDRLARDLRSRPLGDEEVLVVLDGEQRSSADPGVAVAEQERDDLVWAASAALGAEDASLLGLHLRHGLDPGDLAAELGVEPNAAYQRLFRLRKRLGDAIGSWTLWQRGSPACSALQAQLAGAGASRFDRATSTMISTHASECDDCESRRKLVLSPEALFAASPLVLADPAVKARVAAALSSSGVPVPVPVPDPVPAPGSSPADPSGPRPHGGSRLGPRLVAAGLVAIAAIAVVALMVRATGNDDAAPEDVATDSPVVPGSDSDASSTGSTTTSGPGTTPGTSPVAPGPTQPPLAEPGAAQTTQRPPTDPDPTPSPTTAPTTTTSTSAPPPPAPPVISGFRVAPVSGSCSGSRVSVQFTWQSLDATSALLGPSGGIAQPVDPNGTFTTCAVRASTWTLQVTGPGGQATSKTTVPS